MSVPMNNRIFPLILLWLIHTCGSHAQSVVISDGLSLRNDYGYELIGRLRDRILIFRDKYDDFEVQAYDNQMRPSWSKELTDIEKRGIQIIAICAGKNDFSVVYRQRRRSKTVVRVHKYDPGANLIDSMVVKDYGERIFNAPIIDFVRSEDRNCLVIYNDADNNSWEATCLRLDKMQVLWDKKLDLGQQLLEADDQHVNVSNAGDFFFTAELSNRKARIDEHVFRTLHIKPDGTDALYVSPVKAFLTADIQFEYNNVKQQLIGAGLYADRSRDRANGAYFISIQLPGGKATISSSPFDDQFISIIRQKDVSDDTRGIADCFVRQIINRHDGGVIIVVERHHELQRGATSSRGFWRDGARLVVDFYYEDVFAVAFQPDGQMQWKTILHKRQYSQDDEGIFSSYFLFQHPEYLRFLFNDEIKYENTCSEYVISPLGEFDRNNLFNTAGQNLRLRFREAIQISSAECLIPSEFRNKLRLVLLRF